MLALLPTLGDQLFAKHNVEQLTESLRSQTTSASTSAPLEQPHHPPSAAHDQGALNPTEFAPSPLQNSAPNTTDAAQLAASSPYDQQTPPDASSRDHVPSPQLNPLAKSFVPGTLAASPHSESSPAINGIGSASQTQSQPDHADLAIANGTNQLPAVTSEESSTLQTSSDTATESATSVQQTQQQTQETHKHILAPANSDHSHLDAQEQRNKLLADRQAKLRLWNDLKLTAFSRTITSLYCVVLLTLQTHIQLNLIGRFAYLASVQALARETDDATNSQSVPSSDPSRGLDHDTERLYLTFSWWFLHQGWQQLSHRVSDAIEKVFSPLSVKAQLSMTDLRAMLNDVRYLIEHDAPTASQAFAQTPWKRSNFLEVLFPNSTNEEIHVLVGAGALDAGTAQLALASNHKLRALLDETKDIVESQDFATILTLCIDRVFEIFFDSLNPTFGIQTSDRLGSTISVQPLLALESRFQEITEEMQQGKRVRLASLFPLVSRQSQMAIRGVPNEYIEALADSKELRAFSAVLYAAWSSL